MSSLLEQLSVGILVNLISGTALIAIAFGAWYLKERTAEKRMRHRLLSNRSSRLAVLHAELETIIAFTSQCNMASEALEQFAKYQQWLAANGLMSWKQNRHIVHTWRQTSGSAVGIRLGGKASVASDVIDDLLTDMRKTEFPTPADDNFRWSDSPLDAPVE